MTRFEEMLKVKKRAWNVYSQNLCAFGQEAKDKKHVHRYVDTEAEAIELAAKLNYSCTGEHFKVESTENF